MYLYNIAKILFFIDYNGYFHDKYNKIWKKSDKSSIYALNKPATAFSKERYSSTNTESSSLHLLQNEQ